MEIYSNHFSPKQSSNLLTFLAWALRSLLVYCVKIGRITMRYYYNTVLRCFSEQLRMMGLKVLCNDYVCLLNGYPKVPYRKSAAGAELCQGCPTHCLCVIFVHG